MQWYYSVDGEQRGPVTEDAFKTLVADGSVNAQTLVWRAGMKDWVPYGSLGAGEPLPNDNPATEALACRHCGRDFPPGELLTLGERAYCADCKPIVMQRIREGAEINAEDEATRLKFIRRETAIRSVALYYYFVGGITVGSHAIAWMRGGYQPDVKTMLMLGLVFGQLIVAFGLRRLEPWARVPALVLAVPGLMQVPLGTFVNAYALYLLKSRAGKFVFSPEYIRVRLSTPGVKSRLSNGCWIFVALIGLFLAAPIVAALVAILRRPPQHP